MSLQKGKIARAALLCQEDLAMKKPIPSRNVSDFVALVNAMIAYWKSIAERIYYRTHPSSMSDEFEREWPKILENFFLAETVRAAKLLKSLPYEGREN
jgi:hypothetical protein